MVKASIEHLADLARIELGSDEIKRYEKDIENIISYVDKISSVPTSEEPLVSTVTGVSQVLREDEIIHSDADSLLDSVPDKQGRLVRVPKVL